MISLLTLFWLMIMLFAIVGALRGWTKEVISTSGLILSLFLINYAGAIIINFSGLFNLFGTPTTPAGEVVATNVTRQQFFVLSFVHILIAFFSYQGPAFAGARVRDRLRIRDSFQDKVLGVLVGGLNGYLLAGSLWAFLEYTVQGQAVWERLQPGIGYPFDPSVLIRPDIASPAFAMMSRLPIPLLAPYLPILVVVVFLFVIIVMI